MEMMERAQKRVCGKKSADSTYEEIKWAFSTTFDSLASQIVVSQPEKEAKECVCLVIVVVAVVVVALLRMARS